MDTEKLVLSRSAGMRKYRTITINSISKIYVATVPGSSFYSNSKKGRTQVKFCFYKKWGYFICSGKSVK